MGELGILGTDAVGQELTVGSYAVDDRGILLQLVATERTILAQHIAYAVEVRKRYGRVQTSSPRRLARLYDLIRVTPGEVLGILAQAPRERAHWHDLCMAAYKRTTAYEDRLPARRTVGGLS